MTHTYSYLQNCGRITFSSVISIAAFQLSTLPAFAADDVSSSGDIVVTASKTGEQSIQKIPLNISAVGDEQLKKASATTIDDVMRQVPGVNVSGSTGNKTVVVRGLAAQKGSAQVGIYLDESLLPATGNASVAQTAPELFDIARIEVLRGPQGTLYGAGSQAGTVRYITNEPNLNSYEGAFSLDAGVRARHGGDREQVNAMGNVPIVDDVLGVRFAGFARHVDGFVRIPTLDRNHSDTENSVGGRIELLFKPSPDTKLSASLHYQDVKLADTGRVLVDSDTRDNPVLEPFHDKLLIANMTGEQDLGFGTVTATYSHIRRRNSYNFDQSQYLPAPNASVYLPSEYEDYDLSYGVMQQEALNNSDVGELRFASTWDFPLQVTGGLFYNKTRMTADVFGSYVNPTTGLPYAQIPSWYRTHAINTNSNKAAFVNGTWSITDKLKLEGGIRFFEIKRYSRTYTANSYFNATTGWGDPSSSKNTGSVKKAQLSYNFTDRLMAYAVFSQGFREGGANTVFPGASYPASYDPDFVDNYELGFKTQWFDKQLTLNGALYHMNWTGIQVSQNDSTGAYTYTSNGGKATLNGGEVEITVRPDALPGFTLAMTGRYSVQKLAEDNPAVGTYYGLKGQVIPYSNKLGGSVSVDQEFSLGKFPAFVHADVTYTGRGYTALDPNDPQYRPIGKYAIVNLRAGLDNDRWSAALYVKNLTNLRGITTWRVEQVPGLPDRVVTTDPREIGLSLGFKF